MIDSKITKDDYRYLINGNLKTINSFIPTEKLERKKYFKKIKSLKKSSLKKFKNDNILQSIKNTPEYKSLSPLSKIKFLKANKVKFINEKVAEISHDASFNRDKAILAIDFLVTKNKYKKNSIIKIKNEWKILKSNMGNKSLNNSEKQTYKRNLLKLKKEQKDLVDSLRSDKDNKKISKDGYKSELSRNKLLYKGDKNALKMEMKKRASVSQFIYVFHKRKLGSKNLKKVYKSKLIFLANTVPTDYKTNFRTYLSPILELIFPGVGSILNREYFKGMILLFSTLIIYSIAILFATGNITITINGDRQGSGILGLVTLGKGAINSTQPDSRFFLIIGVLAIMFVIIALVYSFLFSRIAYKKAKAMYIGMRGHGKIGLQKYLSSTGFPYIVATPIYLIITFTSIFPLLISMIIVFTNYGSIGHIAPANLITWVGFDNIKKIFDFSGVEGKYFLRTLSWSFIWGIGSTITATIAGIALALLVNHPRMKGKKIIRVLFLFPMAVPFFIMVLYFQIFFGPEGTMNHDIVRNFAPWAPTQVLNISPTEQGVFAKKAWFSDANTVKFLLFTLNIWFGFSGTFIFITGLLQGISKDLYEAADIAGASGTSKFKKITAPIILYQISPILIGSFIGGFNNFGLIYLFSEGGPQTNIGGPGDTDILASYVFKLVANKGQPALAATYMFAIAILFGGLGLAGFSRTKTFRKGKW